MFSSHSIVDLRSLIDRLKERSGWTAVAETFDEDTAAYRVTFKVEFVRSLTRQKELFRELSKVATEHRCEFLGWKHGENFHRVQ